MLYFPERSLWVFITAQAGSSVMTQAEALGWDLIADVGSSKLKHAARAPVPG